eukprot:c10517_g1_i1.p4 GENE.c10517_g1_i1~~c10517_g1_i1.p4  ORF type:complete len:154 (-),score=17.75 c10517_g1_i1:44-505(-)
MRGKDRDVRMRVIPPNDSRGALHLDRHRLQSEKENERESESEREGGNIDMESGVKLETERAKRLASERRTSASSSDLAKMSGEISTRSFVLSVRCRTERPQMCERTNPSAPCTTSPSSRPMISSFSVVRACDKMTKCTSADTTTSLTAAIPAV